MASWILGEKRDGGCSISSSNGMPVLNETYNFTIQTDDKNTSRVNVLLGTPNFPRVNVTRSAYGLSICKGVDANRRKDNPYLWDASATFSSEVEEGQDEQDPDTDPTAWIPIYETKFDRLQELVTRDRNDVAIATSAGQAFPNGVTISRFIPVWEFWQFEPATVDDETLIARNETVNSGVFKNRPAKSLLLTILSSKVGFYYGRRMRLTQYSLKYNKRLWTHKRQDRGSLWKKQSLSTLIKADEDNPNAEVISLDGAGRPAAGYEGSTNKPADTIAAPYTLQFDIYDSISFSFLRV